VGQKIREMENTLDNWKKLMDKNDFHLFKRFRTLSKGELREIREEWKELRRIALAKLNEELNNSGKSGQLLNIDVSDDALYPYLSESVKNTFFAYSRILEFDFGFKPKGIIIIKKGI
jgi:hypothetical protein